MILNKTNSWVLFGVLVVLLTSTALCTFVALFSYDAELKDEQTETGNNAFIDGNINMEHPSEEPAKPNKISFQPVIDDWIKSIGGEKSVMVYDLDRDEIGGIYGEQESYATTSLYKLFVVYEGYKLIGTGKWKADDGAGVTSYNIEECLDLSIRESNSICAETLWHMMGEDYLDDVVADEYGLGNTTVSDFTSTAEDVTMMMKKYYSLFKTDDVLAIRMKDSFLNQPAAEYDWRQGLPSGFSSNVKVYNKVGWDYNEDAGYWNLYHDTAVVEFTDYDRHFVVTVLTSGVPYQSIRKFGTLFEEYFYSNVQ